MEAAFHELGVRVRRASAFEELPEPNDVDRLVLLNAPYRSIYEHEARVEFMLYLDGETYLIEAKRQASKGSTDEKLAFVRLNARHNRDRHRFVLVMEGNGFREGARRWIARESASDDRFDVLTTLDSFRIWLQLKLREADG